MGTAADPARYRRAVFRRGVALALIAFATAFVVPLVVFDYPEEGAVVATFSESHGLHVGDVLLLVGWLVVVGLAVLIGRKPGRRRD